MNSIRIVLADDLEEVRILIRMQLARDDRFEVVGEAADGRAAVEQAERLQPDVVLLDLAMPVMDGLQAIPEIHRVSPECKIVIFSGFSDTHARDRALGLCAHAYVTKGLPAQELAGEVMRCYEAPPKCA